MNISMFKKDDGYYEALASFPPHSLGDEPQPIFRLRAVLLADGGYAAVLRYFHGRGTLIEDDRGHFTLQQTKVRVYELLLAFLKEHSLKKNTHHSSIEDRKA